MRCEQVQEELALALLGKGTLTSASAQHVENCPVCAAEQASLRPVVSLMSRLSADDVVRAHAVQDDRADAASADRVLAGLLAQVAGERRRRTRRFVASLALAASLLVVAAASLHGALTPPASVYASAVANGIHASADIRAIASGSSITLRVSGVPSGTNCRLQVVGKDGSRQTLMTWVADYQGSATAQGSSSLGPADIAKVTIRQVGGSVLLDIPVRA